MEQLKTAWIWAREFNDEGLHIILMVLGMIYIGLKQEEKKHRALMLGYTGIFMVVYFLPPVVWFMDKIIGELVYWRLLWAVPMPVIIAYSMVKVWDKIQGKVKRAGILLVYVALLALMGQNVYLQESPYSERKNWDKLPETAVAVADIINADRGSKDNYALIATPPDLVDYMVQYDGSLRQVYGRKGRVRSKVLMKQMSNPPKRKNHFTNRLRAHKVNYVVLKKTRKLTKRMKKYGFVKIGKVGDYLIYKDSRFTEEPGKDE